MLKLQEENLGILCSRILLQGRSSPGRVSHARCALRTFIQQMSQPSAAVDNLVIKNPLHSLKLIFRILVTLHARKH